MSIEVFQSGIPITTGLPVLIVLSGAIGAGKTSVGNCLNLKYGARLLKTREAIRRLLPAVRPTREEYQVAGDRLDIETGHKWIADAAYEYVQDIESKAKLIVVDAVRRERQVFWLRELKECYVFHVHLFASREVLASRFLDRHDLLDRNLDYNDTQINDTESEVKNLKSNADLAINSGEHSIENLSVEIMNNVDVQFGTNFS